MNPRRASLGPAFDKLTAIGEDLERRQWAETLSAARKVYMDDPTPLPPAIEGWTIHAPDGDGDVWIEINVGGQSGMVNLGKTADVFEKLADWCSRFDPE